MPFNLYFGPPVYLNKCLFKIEIPNAEPSPKMTSMLKSVALTTSSSSSFSPSCEPTIEPKGIHVYHLFVYHAIH